MDHEARVSQWLREYTGDQQRFADGSRAVCRAVEARLKDDGLNYHHVSARVKTVPSVEMKLKRRMADDSPKYSNGLPDLDDLVGVRVITFLERDVGRARTALSSSFQEIEHIDKTAEQKASGGFGYSGQHLVLEVPDAEPPIGCAQHRGLKFEVQLRTVLQHAWAEFEHDIRYKEHSVLPPEVHRAFTLASGLIELADKEFSTIDNVVAQGRSAATQDLARTGEAASLLTADALEGVLEGVLPDNPRSKAEHYSWLTEVLEVNGITTISDATELFDSADWTFIRRRIEYKFPPGHVRAADDYLLQKFGDDYVERTKDLGDDQNRENKLHFRLSRLRRG